MFTKSLQKVKTDHKQIGQESTVIISPGVANKCPVLYHVSAEEKYPQPS